MDALHNGLMLGGGWSSPRVTTTTLIKGALLAGMVAAVVLFSVVLRLLSGGTIRRSLTRQPARPVSRTAAAGEATATPSASDQPSSTPEGVTATAREAPHVHSGAGLSSPVIGNLDPGESVQVVGRTADNVWLQIEYAAGSNGVGWVSASLMNPPADLSSV